MKAIPEFSCFANIDLETRKEIVEFTDALPAYSDFNFVNLNSWNISGRAGVARLAGNLVFRLYDYITDEPFYSFVGETQIVETAQTILAEAAEQGRAPALKLIPENCALDLEESGLFTVTEDIDSHDYLLSIPALAAISGRKHSHTRELVNRFSRENGHHVNLIHLDLADEQERDRLLEVFRAREHVKPGNNDDNELKAFARLLDDSAHYDLIGHGVVVADELSAFIVCEPHNADTVMAHFWKADTKHRGIYQFLLHNLAKELNQAGYSILNFEQDLGIAGLRSAKQYLRPAGFFKKYTVATADLLAREAKCPKDLSQVGVCEIGYQLAGSINGHLCQLGYLGLADFVAD
jgi:hypothetical protein